MIDFFFGMPIKTLGSLGKIRVGRVTGNTHIFFFGLKSHWLNFIKPCKHIPIYTPRKLCLWKGILFSRCPNDRVSETFLCP